MFIIIIITIICRLGNEWAKQLEYPTIMLRERNTYDANKNKALPKKHLFVKSS